MKAWWLFGLLPLALGVALVVLARAGWIENPNLYLSGPISAVALLGGATLTGIVAAFAALGVRAERRRAADLARLAAQNAEEHRRFLRRLDHELKNPLTAIQAGLANLSTAGGQAHSVLPGAEAGALASVRSQVLRLGRLAADLRKLADLEARPLERTPVNVADLLQEVVDLTEEGRELTLSVPRAPWPLPTINGDPDLLFLAFHNLLGNAVKFTAPGDRIEVRALEDGASVVIEVADTGPGIPADEIPLVWEELYRGKSARGIPGSGLGLALVRAIAERHGGTVGLRSREGQGTVFSLRLPAG